MDPKSENEERIKRAVELHEINRQILRKTKLFDEDIQDSLSLYLSNEFDADRIIIHDDSLLIDVKIGEKLLTKDIIKIEKLTGYTFERMSGNDRYVFDKGHYDMDRMLLIKNWPDKLKKVQDYIIKGEESNE